MEQASARKIRRIVILGAGYGGLHVVQRLTARLDSRHPELEITLVDKNSYHQVMTELPLVAAGTRAAQAVRVPVEPLLGERVRFVQTCVNGFDLKAQDLQTDAGSLPYDRLVIAAGSQPNDFGIPGLSERALTLWSVEDARRVLAAVDTEVAAAVQEQDAHERKRHLTVAIGGGGATGVELAGELAEVLPDLASRHDLPADACHIVLVEAAPTLLGGTSAGLVERATKILDDLGVEVRTNSPIAQATEEGFVLKNGDIVRAGLCVWCGGVKVAEIVARSGLGTGPGGRVPVDEYLHAVGHPEIYVVGDAALVMNPATGRPLPPLAQVALEEGDTVAQNLYAEIEGLALEPFIFRDKGFVISIGAQQGVAALVGRSFSGRLARVLKEAIEWEYRQSVKHLRGWSPL
jgi:NADH dehydrogenase